MLDLRLDGGTLVIPGTGLVQGSVGVKDGRIAVIGAEDVVPEAAKRVDCGGKFVLPGIIDPHMHLGIYSDFAKECCTETMSALAGGITTVGCVLRTPNSYFDIYGETLDAVEKNSFTDVIFHLVVETPEHVEQIGRYVSELGAKSFKLYMTGQPGMIPDVDDGFILAALKRMAATDPAIVCCCHAENVQIVNAAMKEAMQEPGPHDLATWERGHPSMAEDEAVQRFSYFAAFTGARAYFMHVSSAEAIRSLAGIKSRYKGIFAEVNSSHLSLTTSSACGLLGKMTPPLRQQEDVEALWEGVRNDVADSLGTDNVSINRAMKQPEKGLFQTRGGKPCLATHLPVLLHEGYHKRGVPLAKIVEKGSQLPAQIFGIYPKKGTIAVGSDADLVVVDLDKVVTVDAKNLHSLGDFSLYDGMALRGWPVMTIKGGEIAVENNVIKAQAGIGKYLRR